MDDRAETAITAQINLYTPGIVNQSLWVVYYAIQRPTVWVLLVSVYIDDELVTKLLGRKARPHHFEFYYRFKFEQQKVHPC